MVFKDSRTGKNKKNLPTVDEIKNIVTKANEHGINNSYREQSLKIHPWVCAKCEKEFTISNIHLLTIHHRDGDHNNNPPDGRNWEHLCVYCHDNEHRRMLDGDQSKNFSAENDAGRPSLTHSPFAALKNITIQK